MESIKECLEKQQKAGDCPPEVNFALLVFAFLSGGVLLSKAFLSGVLLSKAFLSEGLFSEAFLSGGLLSKAFLTGGLLSEALLLILSAAGKKYQDVLLSKVGTVFQQILVGTKFMN